MCAMDGAWDMQGPCKHYENGSLVAADTASRGHKPCITTDIEGQARRPVN